MSVLCLKDRQSFERFSWTTLLDEFTQRVPLLLSILLAAADSKWRRKSGSAVQGKCVPPLCMAMVVLFKTRSKHMSLVQAVMSILLKAGHVTSEVTMYVCMNYSLVTLIFWQQQ